MRIESHFENFIKREVKSNGQRNDFSTYQGIEL